MKPDLPHRQKSNFDTIFSYICETTNFTESTIFHDIFFYHILPLSILSCLKVTCLKSSPSPDFKILNTEEEL
ncbi:hypothetical protein BpHYR1_046073 [Brachionus plicatilis]|uniref:Uncharacterized protein n=1 Tax=Brachionus plicatilis TaxID=10195 RepID=A0A3M7SQU9_BRAPC|nr:hypothetical protein BpHYR1_046073 [Brachionus plicatilis]